MIETLAKAASFEAKPVEIPADKTAVYKISESKEPPWHKNSETNDSQTADIRVSCGKGMESVSEAERAEAVKIVQDSIIFIKEHASTPVEVKTAETLAALAKEGRIVIEDTSSSLGFPAYGYFCPAQDSIEKPFSYISIDYNAALAYGKAEVIDTIAHEAYHAAQHFAGHKNDRIEEETRAWNTGLAMSNKYREGIGEFIYQAEPYNQWDMWGKGYRSDLGTGVFAEIGAENTQEALA
jgi:hypothetical protein